jgi:hypothetical protein
VCGFDAIVVKASATDAPLFGGILIEDQRNFGERPGHIKAETNHND